MRHRGTLAVVALIGLLSWVWAARAEIAEEQKTKLAAVETALREFGTLYKAKKFKEADDLLTQAKADLAELEAAESQDELAPLVAPLAKRMAAAEKLLTAKKPKKEPKEKEKSKSKSKTKTDPPAAMGPSFTKDVAPILVARCAGCHIQDSKGGFSVATYAAIRKGSDAGIVFNPGKATGSRLMDLLEQGEMPRGSGPLSADEMQKISQWIDAGAKFDGADETAELTSLVPKPDQPAPAPEVKLVQSSGNESVQFVRDLAAVLVANCVDCHGGMRPSNRLNLETFAGLLQGGMTGRAIVPGKPAESLLIQKLKGTAADGGRMPLQKTPLEDAVIAKFETWIAEGAKFDGTDPAQSIDLAVRIMVASKMSHEELSAMRADLANKNWRLASPDAEPSKLETDHLLLLGNVNSALLNEVAEVAKAQEAKVAALFKAPAGKPLVKGRLTLFVFNKRFEYSEYGQMVEKRSLPGDWVGHWRFTVIDAYACVVPPKNEEFSLPMLLAEQFAGAYVDSASMGRAPRWFTAGAAKVIAAKTDPRNAAVKLWDEQLKTALGSTTNVDDLLKTDAVGGDSAALSYGFMKFLMAKKFNVLLDELRKGTDFEAAVQKIYGANVSTLATNWGSRAAAAAGRGN